MLGYWLLYLIPAFPAMMHGRSHGLNPAAWIGVALVFVAAIGFRYEVGGDWGHYDRIFHTTLYASLTDALTTSDPGYALLNWMMDENAVPSS